MDIAALVAFAGIYALAGRDPRPGIGAIVARGLARGRQGVVPFIAGFVVGDLVWFVLAAFGLAVVAQTFATAFQILTYAGAAYLLYLAWRIWTSPVQAPGVDPAPEANDGLQAFLGSFALTMGNPKVAVFFLAIMPLVVDVATVSWLAFAETRGDHRDRDLDGARPLCRARDSRAQAAALGTRDQDRQPRHGRADGRRCGRHRRRAETCPPRRRRASLGLAGGRHVARRTTRVDREPS